MDISHVLRRAAVVLGVTMAILFVGARVAFVGVAERYSRDFSSSSSREAESRGVLRGRPAVSADDIVLSGDTLRIVDAWVEQVTHLEYPFFLWRREIQDPRYRLMLTASSGWKPTDHRCGGSLRYSDTLGLGSINNTHFFHVRDDADFPDPIQLSVVQAPGC